MNPTPSKSIRPGLPVRLHAALAASLSRACPRLPALAALCLFATPGVSRAASIGYWTINGTTETWTSTSGDGDGLLTVTGQLLVGYGGAASGLNQTGGTIDVSGASYETIIGQVANGTYNMSGNANFISTGPGTYLGNSANGTWTLTDSSNASIPVLDFGNGGNGYANHLMLSGAATFSATDLVGLAGADEYISFASDSTATFTAVGKTYSDYQALVTAGNIRVDGVAATMSRFKVVGSTLSLATGGPTPPHLVITSVSPASPTTGIGFDVTVETQDDSNTPVSVTADTEVTLTLKTGTGTLGGTMSDTITNGTSSVTISGVTYTKAESGVVLEVSGGSLATGESAPFTVVPGSPAKLAFGVQPNDTDPEVAITPAVTALVQDANGNTVPGDTRSVMIGSSSTAFMIGSVLTMDAVDSVATFAAIEPTTEGTHTLTASDGSLTEATSNPFTVRSQTPDTVANWFVDGPTNRGVDRTVTGYFQVGTYASSPNHWGVLNQTAGTITVPNDGIIIGQAASGPSAYNMSGSAIFNSGTQNLRVGNVAYAGNTSNTWSLTDNAAATIGLLSFDISNGHVLLAGAASVSASDLNFGSGTGNTISFATASTATLTVANKVLAHY